MDNPYQEVDSVISKWVQKHDLSLFTSAQGRDGLFRTVYLSRADECCQIWIDPPEGGIVGVHAADVESLNDEPMRADWTAPTSTLASTLDLAVSHVRLWFARQLPSGQA